MRPYRVLSLDGGGMRGLYSATVLRTLAERFTSSVEGDPDIGKAFDLIVGTSTGGILACGLASGIAISDIISLYKESGPKIFLNPMPTAKLKKGLWAMRFKHHPPDDAHALRTALTGCFDEETVESMYKRRGIGLCLTAVKLATFKPRVFKTPHDPQKTLDNLYKLVDICMATSAAPLYLPLLCLDKPGQSNEFDVYVDGGLWANNPVLVALTEALHLAHAKQPIQILSVGTCPPPSGESPRKEDVDWGTAEWDFGRKVLNISMDAQSTGYDFMASHLSEELSKCGDRSVSVLRLDQSPPPSDFAEFLVLDRADADAQRVFVQMGTADGLTAHSKSLVNGSHFWLSEALSGLPILSKKKAGG